METRSAVLLACLCPVVGLACSCPTPSAPSEEEIIAAYCATPNVFVGSVQDSVVLRPDVVEYRLAPETVFKGDVANPAYALSLQGGDECGYPFEEGKRYLTFADRRAGTHYLDATTCGLTVPYDQADAYLEVIRKATAGGKDPCTVEAARKRRVERAMEQRRLLKEALRRAQQTDENDTDDGGDSSR